MIVISSTNNSQQYTTFSTPTTSSDGFSPPASPTPFTPTSASSSTSSPSAEATFSLSSSALTPASVDELASDSTLQETRLLNATNAELKQQRALNHYSELRFARNSSVNFLTDLAALPNCDPAVVKTALALLAKAASVDSYEPKTYKEAMADAQHKMNWQLGINDEMTSHKNNQI